MKRSLFLTRETDRSLRYLIFIKSHEKNQSPTSVLRNLGKRRLRSVSRVYKRNKISPLSASIDK